MIDRQALEEHLLDLAEEMRAHQFTRVSEGALDYIVKMLEYNCRLLVHRQPSKGKTIRP